MEQPHSPPAHMQALLRSCGTTHTTCEHTVDSQGNLSGKVTKLLA